MADKIQIDADTSSAISKLNALDQKVSQLGGNFANAFGSMNIAATALGATLLALGQQTAAFADDITDLAAANQMAVGEVLALSSALAQSGGSADNAGKILQTLSNKVEEANSGNIKLAGTFGKLGISMSDLGSMSNTQLKDTLLKNIAAIEDPMMRNAKAVEIFGKGMMGVDVRKFAEDQAKGRDEMEKFAPALETAGAAFDNVGKIFFNMKIAFAEAFEPLFKIIKELNPSIDAMSVAFRGAAAALAVITGAAVIRGLLAIRAAIVGITVAAMANPFVALATGLLAVGTAAYTYFGLGSSSADKMAASTDKVTTATGKATREQTGLIDAIQKEKDKITKVGEELQKNFDIVLRKYEQELKYIGLTENEKTVVEAIAKVEEDRIAARAKAEDAYKAQSAEVQALTKATLEAELAGIDIKSAKQKKAIEEQIQSNQALLAQIKDYNNAYSIAADFRKMKFEAEAKADIDSARSINEKINLETRLMAIQKIRSELMSKLPGIAESERGEAAQAISAATDDISLLNKSYYEIGETIKTNLVGNLVDAGIKGDNFNKIIGEGQASFNSVTQSAANYNAKLREVTATSREFSTGWNKAFNEFANNAMNAAQQAQNVFNKLVQGLEDVFINFFKTGKLDFKAFFASIVEEIARAQIKQALVKMLGGIGMGSIGRQAGLGATLAGAAGSAMSAGESPQQKANQEAFFDIKNSIVEFGSSISNFLSSMFSGLGSFVSTMVSGLGSIIGGLGSSLGSIISSIGGTLFDVIGSLGSGLGDILGSIGGGGGGGGILSTLFDVGMSLFGFANGGLIPTNGPVLVGEKGPEILTGAGGRTVIPNDAMSGSTNITYNINAVDAMSFKQMIAADPTFIYAVTQQGAKGMAVRR